MSHLCYPEVLDEPFDPHFLTKWVEVFPSADQSALTIAHLLVEEIVSRHGVPKELLSDRGAAFLSKLMSEIYLLMAIHKVSTTAYHPQTDSLVDRTLTSMLAKTTSPGGLDWDERLPFVLSSYRCSVQQSAGESPFVLCGRDQQLPTEQALSKLTERCYLDSDDYRTELVQNLSDVWECAQNVKAAQKGRKYSMIEKPGCHSLLLETVSLYTSLLPSHVNLTSSLRACRVKFYSAPRKESRF